MSNKVDYKEAARYDFGVVAPKICAIILNWYKVEDTLQCLSSLRKVDYPNFKVVVIDNGSSDYSKEIILEKYPEVALLQEKMNVGCAGGRNVGIRYALENEADYCLLLDDDVVVDPLILKEFLKVAEQNKKAGILGAKIYDYADRERILFAKPDWNTLGGDISKIEEINYTQGCALFFRKEVPLKIGLKDESFFTAYEDLDWCFRARRAGFKILFVPEAKVWHKKTFSSSRKGSVIQRYFGVRNELLWAKKNVPFRGRLKVVMKLFQSFFLSTLTKRNSPLIKRIYWDLLDLFSPSGQAKIRGIADYLMGRFGDCPKSIWKLGEQEERRNRH